MNFTVSCCGRKWKLAGVDRSEGVLNTKHCLLQCTVGPVFVDACMHADSLFSIPGY